ncbi:MAG: hypothetical protein BM560_01115 [Roseobacter sp. MedPE-SWde]|nr:MAG: hypothetical protein BM560_01115 [Roseobacter sp. MedPE-SWde]
MNYSVLDVKDYKTVKRSLLICASSLATIRSVDVDELPAGDMTDQLNFWTQAVGAPLSVLVVVLSISLILRSMEIRLPKSKLKIEFLCGLLPPLMLGLYAVINVD